MKITDILSVVSLIGVTGAISLAKIEKRYPENGRIAGKDIVGDRKLHARGNPGDRGRSRGDPQGIKPIPLNQRGRYSQGGHDEPQYDWPGANERATEYNKETHTTFRLNDNESPPDKTDGFRIAFDEKSGKMVKKYYFGENVPYSERQVRQTFEVFEGYSTHAFEGGSGRKRRETTGGIKKLGGNHQSHLQDFPPVSDKIVENGFTIARAPMKEAVYTNAIKNEADKAGPGLATIYVPNYKNNPTNREYVRGPKVKGHDPAYPTQPVPPEAMQAFLTPGARPVQASSSRRGGYQPAVVSISPWARNAGSRGSSSSSVYRTPGSSPGSSNYYSAEEKRDIIGEITQSEQDANSSSNANMQEWASEWVDLLYATSDNATALLQPILVDLLNGTSSLLGEAMAWSLYSLIDPGVSVFGPFMGNSSVFVSNTNKTNPILPDTEGWVDWGIEVHNFYIELYTSTYNELNKDGLLDRIQTLSTALSTIDDSLLPDDFKTLSNHTEEPLITFLDSMAAYNGWSYSDGSGNSSHNYYFYPDQYTTPDDPRGVLIPGFSEGAPNITSLSNTNVTNVNSTTAVYSSSSKRSFILSL